MAFGAIVAFEGDPAPPGQPPGEKGGRRASIDPGAKKKKRGAGGQSRAEKREQSRKDNLAMCCQILIFVVFLLTFTITVLVERNSSAPLLAAHLTSKIADGPRPVSSILDGASLYSYLRDSFVPAMYDSNIDTLTARNVSNSLHPIDGSNRLLGGVRLRQVRVKLQEQCQMGPMFDTYTISCYPPFGAASESRDAFGPGGKFAHSADPEGVSIAGKLGSYSGDGFAQILPSNRTKALEAINQLEADKFVDDATRAVFVDFNIWNSNLGMYAVVGIYTEFAASGGVKHTMDVVTMTPSNLAAGGLGFTTEWLGFVGNLILISMVAWFVIEETQEVCSSKWGYLKDWFWNTADWLNMSLIVTAFVFKIMSFTHAGSLNIGAQELVDKSSFTNLRALSENVESARLLNSLNAVFMWCKLLKFYRFMPGLRDLIKVIWRALFLFCPYLIMFSIAFIGFAMSYNIGFGDKIFELSTFASTITYLCRAFIRDVELMPAYDITPAFGALLILLFYVAMVLVGTIVMFAILANAQFEAKYDKSRRQPVLNDLHEDEPLEEVARVARTKIRRFIRRRFPWWYVKIYGSRKLDPKPGGEGDNGNVPEGNAGVAFAIQDGEPSKPRAITGGWRRALDDGGSAGGSSYMDDDKHMPPTRDGLMRAIEHMSGRVLSEISILGIEIKSELHDVYERVSQMKIAVEELSWRADQIHLEQSEAL
jgi:hypothetical protein